MLLDEVGMSLWETQLMASSEDDLRDPVNWIIPNHISQRTYEKKFRARLKKKGLGSIYIDVIVLKFVYEYSLEDITVALELRDALVAHTLLKEGLDFLRKRGYK